MGSNARPAGLPVLLPRNVFLTEGFAVLSILTGRNLFSSIKIK